LGYFDTLYYGIKDRKFKMIKKADDGDDLPF
jgi:hypothetical protein